MALLTYLSSRLACYVMTITIVAALLALPHGAVASTSEALSPWGLGRNAPDVVPFDPAERNRRWAEDIAGWSNLTAVMEQPGSLLIKRASNFWLRVMPLGASITQGVASTDGNGYRRHLRDKLRFEGWNVNMVGSQATGNMRDRVRIDSRENRAPPC